jgi:Cu-processing system ATP-binding protein
VNPVAELLQVDKRYTGVQALRDLSLTLQGGEVLGLLGHNGAGKTTAMKLLLGVIAPSAGAVRLFGESPTGPRARQLRLRIGYLPESVRFYEQLSGREVLRYFARLKGVARAEQAPLLEQVGLGAAADRRVRTYSKGMRQRLGLAQALLGKPRLLLLDEPTAGLDPLAIQEFYQLLDRLRSAGTTVLLSSHVLPGIERHIDRAAILGQGRLRALGTLEELSLAAGLPLTIRARGQWNGASLNGGWESGEIQVRRIDGSQVEILTPRVHKLSVMRRLLNQPGLQDVDIATPTLDHLYRYYNHPDTQESPA